MTVLRQWLSVWLEWTLLGVGVGCLTVFAYDVVEARRVRAGHAAAFAEARAARSEPATRSEPTARTEPEVIAGGLVGMLDIPRLKLTTAVIEGDDEAALQHSVGHLPDTPLPWQPGNSALAGHRDGLFRPLKDIRVGDEIRFRSTRHERRYRVTRTMVVEPDDLSVLESGPVAALTLITCYPFRYVGPAPRRFIVRAELLQDD